MKATGTMKTIKTMKRLAAALLLVAVAAGCAGCGQTDDGTMSLEEGTKKYLSVRKIGDDRLISIGMSREAVEKILGEPTFEEESYGELYCDYDDALAVYYDEAETVVTLGLRLAKEATAEYETPAGLRPGDSLEKAQAAYNNYLTNEDREHWATMMTAGKKWKLQKLSSEERREIRTRHREEENFDLVWVRVNIEANVINSIAIGKAD